MAADRRKIQRLEEELAESESKLKKVERENKRLERDLKEANDILNSQKDATQKEEWMSKKTTEILDNKSLERTIQTQREEIEKLEEELKILKERFSQSQRSGREQLRADVDSSTVRSQYESQIESLHMEFNKERELAKTELNSLKEDLERERKRAQQNGGRRGGVSSGGGASRITTRGTGGLDSLLSSNPLENELAQLKKKMALDAEKFDKETKKWNKEKADLENKIAEANLKADRSEKKYKNLDEENKKITKNLESETKAKWDIEKVSLNNEREVKTLNQRLKDGEKELLRTREELSTLTNRLRNYEDSSKDASGTLQRVEKEMASLKKAHSDELEKTRVANNKKVESLEAQLKELKELSSKNDQKGGDISIENGKLRRELQSLNEKMAELKEENEREKKRLERNYQMNEKNLQEEMERMKEEGRRAEERLKKKVSIGERDSLGGTPSSNLLAESTSKVEEEMRKEKEKQKGQKLESDVNKLREMITQMEKKHEIEVEELKSRLQEREKGFQNERSRWINEQESRESEMAAERKKNLEKEKKRSQESEEIQNELIELRHKRKALEDELRKVNEEWKNSANNLEDEREERKIEADKNSVRIKVLQEELLEKSNDLSEVSADFKKSETLTKQLEEDLKETTRKLEDTKLHFDETFALLNETEEKSAKSSLEFKQKLETLEKKLGVATREAETESKEKEKQTKLRQAAEKRVEELEWYFLPLEEQEDKKEDFSTPALALLKRMKKEQLAELDLIRGKYSKQSDVTETLHKQLVEGLEAIPDTNKEAIAYQLQGLMQILEDADFPILTRMRIAVAVVTGLVDPEIIRELRILTEIMVEDSLHFMDTPETMVRLAQRDLDEEKSKPDYATKKRSEVKSFRDFLLARLASNRAKRMFKSEEEVTVGIMEELYTKKDG